MRGSRIAIGALVALGLAAAAPAAAPAGGAAAREPPSVVLVTHDCELREFFCPPFAQAARRTGTRARIVSLDARQDVAGTFALLARQGHDLVIGDPEMAAELADVAERYPGTRFATIDIPVADARDRPPNVTVVEIRPSEAAYLAGWLAGRMERRRPGPDAVGVVGGFPVPPVDAFVAPFRAGALRAAPGARVLTGYSRSFVDPTACAAVAEREVAEGAGVIFDVAGGCGPGTLDVARDAGVWAVGVDRDRAGLGPFILTSVLKRYDRAFALLMRQARDDRAPTGRAIVLGLRRGGTELGRISPRVPDRVLRELAAVRRAILRGAIRVPGAG
ncbi:MAG TPA: BMP family ABC transporter substrate-binding protein [Miltoncostaea sp.]|nr:BMP family ABC transporter substrate-binding protein [Miltoncostaea sp.]